MIRFEHRAVPIALAAVTIDVIGFGIVMGMRGDRYGRRPVLIAATACCSGWSMLRGRARCRAGSPA